jgi:hypothetical protein
VGHPNNEAPASRGVVAARPNPSSGQLLEEGGNAGRAGQRARGAAERGHGQRRGGRAGRGEIGEGREEGEEK